MGKNYRRHQIGIREIVQLSSNKHGFKSSRSLLFYKEMLLKSCRILMKTPETCTSNKKQTLLPVLSYEFCEIFKNPFLQNTSGRLLLDFFHLLSCFFATRLTNRNQVFSVFEHVLLRLSNVMNIMNFAFTLFCETDDWVVAAGKPLLLQAFLWDTSN